MYIGLLEFIFADCLFKYNQQQQVQERAKQYLCFCRVPALQLCKYVYIFMCISV